jgi:hypothetical protein
MVAGLPDRAVFYDLPLSRLNQKKQAFLSINPKKANSPKGLDAKPLA